MKAFLFIAFALIIAILAFDTCVTLKSPQVALIAEVTAQNAGYIIAKKNPTEVKQLLDKTQAFLDSLTESNAATLYPKWTSMVLALAVKDPYLRMNFEKLLTLVEIDLKGKDPTQYLPAVQQVLNDFLTGLNAGLTP